MVRLVWGRGDHCCSHHDQDILPDGGCHLDWGESGSDQIQSCNDILYNLRLFEGRFQFNTFKKSWTSLHHNLWLLLTSLIAVQRYPYKWSRQIEKIGVHCNKIPSRSQVWTGTIWWRVSYLPLTNEVNILPLTDIREKIKFIYCFSRARRTYCGHIFHPLCLSRAISVVPACPVCKQSL